LLLSGCSFREREVRYPESGATLEGTVTYGKDKVGAALVIARNETGQAMAFVEDNGHYKLENVPLGEVNIAVDTETGKSMARGKAMAQGKAKGAPRIIDVPKQFADSAKSGIKTTVNKGANTFDIIIERWSSTGWDVPEHGEGRATATIRVHQTRTRPPFRSRSPT
jgi:hypothetical protein